jgi:hypothetical protein
MTAVSSTVQPRDKEAGSYVVATEPYSIDR